MLKIVKSRGYRDILKGHKAPLLALFSPYGPNAGFLFSISTDGLIRIWNLIERKIESKLILSSNPNETVLEESNLALDMGEMALDEKEKQNNEENKNELIFVQSITASLFSEKCVYGGYENGLICCWNIKSGELLYKMEGHKKKIMCLLRISPGTILSSSYDHSLKLWDTMNGNMEIEYIFPHIISSIYFENETIYCVGAHSHFYSLNYKNDKIKPPINFNNIMIISLIINENTVIFSTINNELRVYDLQQLEHSDFSPKKIINVNSGWLRCMKKLSNFLFIGCDDKVIRVFDLKTFQLVEAFNGHEDGITSLEFADGMLYSGSSDHTIRSWDLKEMENRIRERRYMIREDILSRKFQAYNAVIEKKKKKKKKGKKKGKKGKSMKKK